jgi:sulfur-oxidizing protein SoxY
MGESGPEAIISRRRILTGSLAVSFAVAMRPIQQAQSGTPQSTPLTRSVDFLTRFAELIGDASPVEGAISIDIPEIAENGNFVPLTITIDSPMTDDDHIRKIHLLSTANPVADVATFHLSPINGLARVQSRMRLSKTQDVVVVAERSDGTMLVTTVLVKVTIGGCGS